MKTRSPMKFALPALAAALLLGSGCATTQASGTAGGAASAGKPGAGSAPGQAGQPQISNRAQLLFEEGVKASEAALKGGREVDYAELERKFRLAQDADPDLAEADYNLGVLAERQGRLDEARRHYETALRKKPSLAAAQENLAVLALNAGDSRGALAQLQELLKRSPDHAGARARLAELYRQAGDHDRALEYARAALLRDPQSLTALKVMLKSHTERKQLALAKLVALRAMKVDANDAELHYALAQLLLAEGDGDAARLELKRTLELRQDFLPAHSELARLALQSEDYPGAEQHLRRLLQADGKSAAAHLNLGVAYKGQGQLDKAMQEYDEAERLDPRLPQVALNRAILLHKHKDAPERALELYKKYLQLAGSELAVSADAPVFALIKEAEQAIQFKAEAARLEAEARKQAEAQAKAEAEAKNKPAPAVAPAAGKGQGSTQPARATEPAPKAAPQPAPKPAPQKPRDADEPSDAL